MLQSLTKVFYDVSIRENFNLVSLKGLEQLSLIKGELSLIQNSALQTTVHLAALQSVGRKTDTQYSTLRNPTAQFAELCIVLPYPCGVPYSCLSIIKGNVQRNTVIATCMIRGDMTSLAHAM